VRFIASHADHVPVDGLRWGVEPICRVLSEHGTPIAPSTYYDTKARPASRREVRDERLKRDVARGHAANYGIYGPRKVWLQLRREGSDVARCTIERLMRELGLAGAHRGKRKRTTIADPQAPRTADFVKRHFAPLAPNTLWVADFTCVSTWSGWVYVAFVIEHAIWTRQRDGVTDLTGVIHPNDRGSQYTSVAFTERLIDAGIDASIGATGSSCDNAVAETINGLYKTELIKPRGPWRTLEQVEIATLEWVDWFNNRRIYEHCGDMPPIELEALYYQQNETRQPAGLSN
jgi:putative transposase